MNNKGLKILFFGRKGCEYSCEVEKYLRDWSSDVLVVKSEKRFETMPENVENWQGDLIICFRSHFILSEKTICAAKVAAINFHPGPPNYRGTGCLNFALYNGETEFGVTVHLIEKKVDSGRIIYCSNFAVDEHDCVAALLKRTHQKLFEAFLEFYRGATKDVELWIEKNAKIFSSETWTGPLYTLKNLEDLQTLNPTSTRKEFDRVVRATNTEQFPTRIEKYGYTFLLNNHKTLLDNLETEC